MNVKRFYYSCPGWQTDWQLLSFEKCSYVPPPHSFFSQEESKTGLTKMAEIMQATLNGVCANNSVCVLAKKCISRFTHLLWIFARAQGWVGHLSDLYRCEYVKPCTNVNVKKIKQTKMGSWADFVNCTTPLFISFFRNCSHLYSLHSDGVAAYLWSVRRVLTIHYEPPGVPLGILGGGVPPGSPNPDPI